LGYKEFFLNLYNSFDGSIFSSIADESLLDHMKRINVIFYEKSSKKIPVK